LNLLCPQIPMLFLGDEIGSRAPFLYFTDHKADLAEAVRKGRAAEFPSLNEASVPDPNAVETFERSLPANDAPESQAWRKFYRELLCVRQAQIVPRLAGAQTRGAEPIGSAAVLASWTMSDGSVLTLATNLADEAVSARVPRHVPIWGRPESAGLPPHTTTAWIGAA
jgi:maltooligosyltrehalose trehalohydrolase